MVLIVFVLACAPRAGASPASSFLGPAAPTGAASLRDPRSLDIGGGSAGAAFDFTLYRGEWFRDQASEAMAQAVAVASPVATVGIDLALDVGGGTIAGRVTRMDSGAPLGGIVVFALGQSSAMLSFDRSDADGRYRITGIPADQFLVGTDFLSGAVNDDYATQHNQSRFRPRSSTSPRG
jgi:hypothetical protein